MNTETTVKNGSTTAKKGRPTPKQNKGTQAPAYGTAPLTTAAPSLERTPFGLLWRTLLALATMALFTPAVFFVPGTANNTTVVLALFCIPALVTMVFVPRARTQHLYRWPIVWLLGFTSQLVWPTLIIGQTWVLLRFWYIESRPQMPRRKKAA